MQGFNIVGVQFKRAGKIYDFLYQNIHLRIGDKVLVETERGESIGKVVLIGFLDKSEKPDRELKSVVRKVFPKEINKSFHLTVSEIARFAKRKISRLKLDMNVLKSEILYGGNRIVIYFSSPGRVDFRELVKDLASGLKARVELKQVGSRDETKLLGGVGVCGREYCCSSFLREFIPVSIKMAKNQNLALNPNKVSGGCGRLLCCLTYENKAYSDLRKTLPPIGSEVEIKETGDRVIVEKSDLLTQNLLVKLQDGSTSPVKVSDVTLLQKKNFSKNRTVN